MHGGQSRLLAGPDVSGHKTLARLCLALLVGLRGRHHHLTPAVSRSSRVQTATHKLSETVSLTDVLAIDLTSVNEGCVLVELLPGSQPLLAWQGASEGDTMRSARGDVEGREVGIVPGDWDWPTLRMNGLGGVTSPVMQ